MRLNAKHTIDMTIPRMARKYEIPVSHGLNVRMILIGVPSSGTPPIKINQENTIIDSAIFFHSYWASCVAEHKNRE